MSGPGSRGGVPLGSGRAWAELLRVSALFTVPGDALAGAAATGLRPNRRTVLAIAASLSLYEAGMALNDWADRAEDAIERPHRPLPSGRIAPAAALGAAAALTAGGLALAAGAGRPALTVASGLAATVWAYDLGLKHTPAGPVAMAAARSLDLLLGAAATSAGTSPGEGRAKPRGRLATTRPGAGAGLRAAVPTALVLGAHTLAVTAVSRREAQGGSTAAPLCALAATVALAQLLARSGRGGACRGAGAGAGTGTSAWAGSGSGTGTGFGAGTDLGTGSGVRTGTSQLPVGRGAAATRGLPGSTSGQPAPGALAAASEVASVLAPAGRRAGRPASRAWPPGGVPGSATGRPVGSGGPGSDWRTGARGAVQAALAATYAVTAARPLFHAALNPSPQLTQRAVGGGIRAMIPLQAALSARTGALGSALLTAALAPAARKFGRKVSVT
ncbi:SCO3242 family prenyltransferase [Streptomyces sp. NPDC047525]|uniref:SCO3242 family prenyltransferase n=1 Tax=Streptomyces sp. NPDC047525 TaxID=3155264 RepID=UPI0033DF32B4